MQLIFFNLSGDFMVFSFSMFNNFEHTIDIDEQKQTNFYAVEKRNKKLKKSALRTSNQYCLHAFWILAYIIIAFIYLSDQNYSLIRNITHCEGNFLKFSSHTSRASVKILAFLSYQISFL